MSVNRVKLGALAAALLFLSQPARAQTDVTAGEFTVERPTLVSLGFDWRIDGDDNSNASVEVTYRKLGDSEWKQALPLLRLHGEKVVGSVFANAPGARATTAEAKDDFDAAQASVTYVAPNMFSGSILNLEPGTRYECVFVLKDPDGAHGDVVKIATVTTRSEPVPAEDGNVFHVYPVGYQGPKQEPSFIGLMSAYYLRAPQIDWQNAYPPRVRPGDTILVHAGEYRGDRLRYTIAPAQPGNPSLGNVFDGTYYLTASGTPDRPIVIKGAGDGEAIFDGDGAQNLFNLMAANYNYFEGITVRNTNVAFLLGLKSIVGASGFTLKRSRIYDVGRAVQDDWSGSKDFYIADNVFVGRHDPLKMMTWWGGPWAKFPDSPELLRSEYAVKLYGQGHVVAFNYFGNWHDGIDVATYGLPDGSPAEIPDRVPVSIDFYNNDFYNMGDNCMEADGGAHNIRLFRNRCFNAPGAAISAQPLWGGPLYVYQNVVFNVPTFGACKVWPAAGILIYQNTFVGECHIGDTPPNLNLGSHALNVHLANNLILATGAIGFDGAPMSTVFAMTADTENSTSDFNGFRPNPGRVDAFEWDAPKTDDAEGGSLGISRFTTLQKYSASTAQDRHSRLVDFDAFVRVSSPKSDDLQKLYDPENYDFALMPGSTAIDAGTLLPTITDGFTGKAPDLGALEFGRPAPHYGPRTRVPGIVPQDKAGFRSWVGPPPGK